MRYNFLIILFGTVSLIILLFILYFYNIDNYQVNYYSININNQNISLYKINLYIQGCYNLSTNGYFIIYPIYNIPELGIPAIDYMNTTNIIFCNESLQFNKTIKSCSPIVCPDICTTEGCIKCNPECYNYTFYINISYPIMIVNNSFFIKYQNNLYSSGKNIGEYRLSDNYLYNNIIETITNITTIIV